ncbi:hypothetical protein C0Q70_08283 [Pomacea canaliculata]|uniref:Uncharacterized protein n=1 Tax=Pomacea canaliculata TaxID=400727 RepID=A0A2T7PHD5_POMCA|nr:hypothetical protein C0Q70_08283 [Pomacea canaliculata]
MTTTDENPQTNTTEEDSFTKPNGEAPYVQAWYGDGNNTGAHILRGAFRDEKVIEENTKKEIGSLKTKKFLKNVNDEAKHLNIKKVTHYLAGNFQALLPEGEDYFSKGTPVQSTKQKTPVGSRSVESLREETETGRDRGGGQRTFSKRRHILSVISREQNGAVGPSGRTGSIKRAANEDVEQSSHLVLAKTSMLPRKGLMKPAFISRYKDLDFQLEDVLANMIVDADDVPDDYFDGFLPEENGLREIMATFSDSYRVPLVEVEIREKDYTKENPHFRIIEEKVDRIRRKIFLRQGESGNALTNSDRTREKRYANTPEQTARMLDVKEDMDEGAIDLKKENEEIKMDWNEEVKLTNFRDSMHQQHSNNVPNLDVNGTRKNDMKKEEELKMRMAEQKRLVIPTRDLQLESFQVSVTGPHATTDSKIDITDKLENLEDQEDFKTYDKALPEHPKRHTVQIWGDKIEEGDDLLVDGNLDDIETMLDKESLNLEREAETVRLKEVSHKSDILNEAIVNEGDIPLLESVEIEVDDIGGGDDTLVVDDILDDMEKMPHKELLLQLESEAGTEKLNRDDIRRSFYDAVEIQVEDIEGGEDDGNLNDMEMMSHEEDETETLNDMISDETDTLNDAIVNEDEIPFLETVEVQVDEIEDTLLDDILSDTEMLPHENPLNLESEVEAEAEMLKEAILEEANTETMVNEGIIPALETFEIHVEDIEGGEDVLDDGNLEDRETMPHENPLNLESEDKAETEMLKEAILEEANTDDRETMPHENPLNLESEDKAETEMLKEAILERS